MRAQGRTNAPSLPPVSIAYGRRCRFEGAYASSELVRTEEKREGTVCCVCARVRACLCLCVCVCVRKRRMDGQISTCIGTDPSNS